MSDKTKEYSEQYPIEVDNDDPSLYKFGDEDDDEYEEEEGNEESPSSELTSDKDVGEFINDYESKVVGLHKIVNTDDSNSLLALTGLIDLHQRKHNMTDSEVRHNFFETTLKQICLKNGVIFDNLIISSAPHLVDYNNLLVSLYPSLEGYVGKRHDESLQRDLIRLLAMAIELVVTGKLSDVELVKESSSDGGSSVVDEEDDFQDPELITTTMRILDVYQDLFEVGFELVKPFGILTKEGYLHIRQGKTRHVPVASLGHLYNMINNVTGGFLVQSTIRDDAKASELREVSMRQGTTYYPEFQLGNLLGHLGNVTVDTWLDLRKALRPEIMRNVHKNLKAGKNTEDIIDSLTTCIVISDFNANSALKLRINVGNNRIMEHNFVNEYNKNKKLVFSGMGDLYHRQQLKSGVLELTLVFNEAAFNGKPLFAYEAIKNLNARGKKPSIKNMILGQDTSGKILTANFDTQQACIVLIGAGQRSGKGVLTLNLLGTVLANGSPLIYMDGKPDMAPVLWDMGKKYGSRPAAWDMFEHNGRQLGLGSPDVISSENPGLFGVLVYLKMVQLMMVAASLQAKDVQITDGKRPFFVFDEAFAVQQTIESSFSKIMSIAKNKGADQTDSEWSNHIIAWSENLTSDLGVVINSQLPKSGVSTVWLFQKFQKGDWTPLRVKGITGYINPMEKAIYSSLSMKFLGKGTSDTEYALGHKSIKEHPLVTRNILGDGRHFGKTSSQKLTSIDGLEVFKPYLVLNSAETGSKSAEELKSNVSDDVLRVIAPDGDLHEGAGFEGFAKLIGSDAIDNLSKGREYLDALVSLITKGQFGDIDDYLYDASLDSFKSMSEWVKRADDPAELEGSGEEGYYSTTDSGFDFTGGNSPIEPVGGSESQQFEYVGTPTQPSGMDTTGEDIVFTPDSFERTSTSPASEDLPFESLQPTGGTPFEDTPFETPSRLDRSPVEHDEAKIPEDNNNFASVYEPNVSVPVNPFKPSSRSDRPLSAIHSLNTMSGILLSELEKMVGDLSRIYVFEITATGLVVNNIAFRPKFDPAVIESMPFDIKQQVVRGNLVELFNFKHIAKFRNLESLHIDDIRIAEGRFRREANFAPRKTWIQLFQKYRSLVELTIGGKIITDEESSESYEQQEKKGLDLQNKIADKIKLPSRLLTSSHMTKAWESRPVRIVTGALGWTAGVKAVAIASAMFGGWGILFGAFGAYGAYKTHKSRKER